MISHHRASMLGGLLIALVLLAGCQPAAPAAKQYPVIGKVVAIDAAKPAITIDHQDIPGLMSAMQMEFTAKDPALLANLAPGDEVEAQLEVTGEAYVITSLRKR